MSDWGWHKFENTMGLTPSESEKSFNLGHGHPEVYAVEYKKKSGSTTAGGSPADTLARRIAATEYFRVNPHRLNLGCIGLELFAKAAATPGAAASAETTETPVPLTSLTDIHQELKLYDGIIESSFAVEGSPVEVTTAAMNDRDAVIYRIKSKLLKDGNARVSIRFPYPTGKHADDAADWSKPEQHTSRIIDSGKDYAIIEHVLDSTVYYLSLRWQGDATLQECERHFFELATTADVLMFEAAYKAGPAAPKERVPFFYEQSLKAVIKAWNRWWNEGAIVDFSQCTDPRAKELERRVVLSQYLTQVNCANALPPQETGLTYNSWFGRPHLEMAWWHLVDFALWNRPKTVATVLDWYNKVAYPEAEKIAQRQGFKGVRWMKMTDPWAGEAPSNTGSFLIGQQPHYIYMAEEMYRANPTAATLQKYAEQVEQTAAFMADFVSYDAKAKKYYLQGATSMQESMSKDFSYNHPFELAYWQYGLSTANLWRERMGKGRNPQWDNIASNMSPLPMTSEGIYIAGLPKGKTQGLEAFDPFDTVGGVTGAVAASSVGSGLPASPSASPASPTTSSASKESFAEKCRNDHPAVLGAFGLLPACSVCGDMIATHATLDWVMNNWNWATTWGWDYGMTAMAAARLGEPETALKALLINTQKNTYLTNGHNFQTADRLRIYLPGNGALLTAVAMMCAGWDGCLQPSNPGFPSNGQWNVRWEGLHRMQ
jgi:hypothetical protein